MNTSKKMLTGDDAMGPFVMGIEGYSGSGKTTLIEKLIPLFKAGGLKLAVIKHDAHDFDMDKEGKDTYRFYEAGADTVMISSKKGSAVFVKEARTAEDMISEADADLILVEGFKHAGFPKILIASQRTDHDFPGSPDDYKAIVTDVPAIFKDKVSVPVFDIDDASGIAEWIIKFFEGADTEKKLTHFDDEGNARMVDVSDKEVTLREAAAAARVMVNRETFELIKKGCIKKGDVLTVAQIAGIMGAKRTPDLIPMCHPVITDETDVRLKLNENESCIEIEARVRCTGRTGVEMEAICACSVAAMTVYDMCKAVQRDIVISDIRLMSKTGGIHGDYIRS